MKFHIDYHWIAFLLLLLSVSVIMGTQSATATSQLEQEADAILKSQWWNTSNTLYYNISNRCKWYGISCNKAGSIIMIEYYSHHYSYMHIQFVALNFSVFHNLERLVVRGTRLQGSIPAQFGTHLTKLTHLDLSFNNLQGEIPPSLANLTLLDHLDISYNNIKGSIPLEFGFLKNLTLLNLSNNKINENLHIFPTQNFTRLYYLDISNNLFVGSLPSSFGQLTNLQILDISNNFLTGVLPISLTNLSELFDLDISNNLFAGSLPSSFCWLTNLKMLFISNNLLVGSLPYNIGRLSNLEGLILRNNNISGTLPISLTNLTELIIMLDMSHNLLSGSLPSQLFQLPKLKELCLNRNFISGIITIPPLPAYTIQVLDLSYNNLSGMLPQYLCTIHDLDISYNSLEELIPERIDPRFFVGNKDLCTHILEKQIQFKFKPFPPPNKTRFKVSHNVIIVLPIVAILILILFSLLLCLRHRRAAAIKNKKPNTMMTKNGDLFCVWNYDGKIAYDDIIKATEDFDIKYCIGTGAYGSVYKAELPSGKVVALKKLHGYETEIPSFDESFRNEVRVLTEIKHRHIVKLYGFCLHNKIMFLIYQYMEKGSLFCLI